ncbi:DoxX family membrane protein [Dinghuibacter silviterrae]|uniref:Thiosulfate dehydrogenase [quinone] large subunit n=1 Tax=Dinghuibacter silviterrae TaxID=1539049 RepID=A0A4R8DRJ0_9BACT|nr:DoxX family membrane protein [Dinghuibacter silviterrae]TDX00822.1 thiosulfate dehydrogenase [quinone] large subunit [Dinghuibacter silviterrae]
MKRYTWAYLMARLPIAMSFLGHGLVRMPKLEQFSLGLTIEFNRTFFPLWLLQPFSYVLPFLELLTGILLLLGLFTRFALFLGGALMLILIFGSTMIEEWQNVAIQLFYGVYLAGLLALIDHNGISLDARSSKKPGSN